MCKGLSGLVAKGSPGGLNYSAHAFLHAELPDKNLSIILKVIANLPHKGVLTFMSFALSPSDLFRLFSEWLGVSWASR